MSNTNSENSDTSKIGKRNKFEDCLDAEGEFTESKKNVAVDSLTMSSRLDKASDTTKGKLICICNVQRLASNICLRYVVQLICNSINLKESLRGNMERMEHIAC